jgi:hypothetical protein
MLAGLLLPASALAQVAQLRIASVVPKNSPYHQSLLELGEAWRTAQGAGARHSGTAWQSQVWDQASNRGQGTGAKARQEVHRSDQLRLLEKGAPAKNQRAL